MGARDCKFHRSHQEMERWSGCSQWFGQWWLEDRGPFQNASLTPWPPQGLVYRLRPDKVDSVSELSWKTDFLVSKSTGISVINTEPILIIFEPEILPNILPKHYWRATDKRIRVSVWFWHFWVSRTLHKCLHAIRSPFRVRAFMPISMSKMAFSARGGSGVGFHFWGADFQSRNKKTHHWSHSNWNNWAVQWSRCLDHCYARKRHLWFLDSTAGWKENYDATPRRSRRAHACRSQDSTARIA